MNPRKYMYIYGVHTYMSVCLRIIIVCVCVCVCVTYTVQCLNELGECKCVVHANVAVGSEVRLPICIVLSCIYMYITKLPDLYCVNCVVSHVQEVDERFLLVFTEDFVILAVGRSLSGYEMKVTVL